MAGSKIIKHTGTLGDLFKEAVKINLALTPLYRVVNKLAKNNDNTCIALEGSKLILLLENSS